MAGNDASSTALILGVFSLFGVSVPPIIVALIGRMGSSPKQPRPDDAEWVSRRQFDAVLDDYSRADEVNQRMGRDLDRAHAEIDRLRDELEYLRSGRGGARRSLDSTDPGPTPDRRNP